MVVYLAASWTRRNEIKMVATYLRAAGIEVRARWLDEEPVPADPDRERFLIHRATEDVEDVLACDVLVRFTDDLTAPTVPSRLATGARMFEMGLAWGAGKQIVVVGGHQCIFDHLPVNITHVRDVQELKNYLLSGSKYAQ